MPCSAKYAYKDIFTGDVAIYDASDNDLWYQSRLKGVSRPRQERGGSRGVGETHGGNRNSPSGFLDRWASRAKGGRLDFITSVAVDDDRNDKVHGDITRLKENESLGEVTRVAELRDEAEEASVTGCGMSAVIVACSDDAHRMQRQCWKH